MVVEKGGGLGGKEGKGREGKGKERKGGFEQIGSGTVDKKNQLLHSYVCIGVYLLHTVHTVQYIDSIFQTANTSTVYISLRTQTNPPSPIPHPPSTIPHLRPEYGKSSTILI